MVNAIWYYLKAIGVWAVASQAWFMSNVSHDWITPIVGGTVSLVGLGVLIWKLLTDYSREKRIAQEYEEIIRLLRDEIRRLKGEE